MKLILLPGMDGTGMLFEPLLRELRELDTEVVPLPNSGPQDYASLAEVVANIIASDSGSGLASCIRAAFGVRSPISQS